ARVARRRPALRHDHLGGKARARPRGKRDLDRGPAQRPRQVRALLALPRGRRHRPGASDHLRALHEQPVRRRRNPALRLMTRPGGEAATGRRGPLGRWLALALVVVALDQASKWAILGRFEYGERLNLVPGWFDFTLVYNTGAAFSFLADAAGWQRWFFTALALVASGVIVFLLRRHGEQTLFSTALALIDR